MKENPEIKLIGEFIRKPDKPLIRDLIVEGLSSKNSKRRIASILSSNNNDIEILIKKLEEFANN